MRSEARALSETDFARARKLAPQRTRVFWSQGWARFALGDPTCAIESWQQAAARSSGDAFWIPYTLATGYWAAGEHQAALAYYAAAARSYPEWFGTASALERHTRHWKPREQAAIKEAAHAWWDSPVGTSAWHPNAGHSHARESPPAR